MTHLTGAIVHTVDPSGKQVYAFVDMLQWPHDSNLTLDILEELLLRFCTTNQTHLTEVLYLQMDNCYWENNK